MLELDDLFENVNIVDEPTKGGSSIPNKHIEIEVKFKIKPHYKLVADFDRLLSYMRRNYDEVYEESVVTSYPKDLRRIVSIDPISGREMIIHERKTRLKDYHKYTNDYGFVISISEEVPIHTTLGPNSTNARRRDRYSFKYNPLYQVDMTKVFSLGTKEQSKPPDSYEIELEYLGDYRKLDLIDFEQQILFIYQILNQTEHFITPDQRTQLINEFNDVFNVPAQKNISKDITVKARNIKYLDLTFGGIVGNLIEYRISHKADGIDHFLIMNKVGIWLVSNTAINLIYYYAVGNKLRGQQNLYVYKCEVTYDLFDKMNRYYVLIYDCLVYKNENIMDIDLDERVLSIEPILVHLNPMNVGEFRFKEKKHHPLTLENFFVVVNEMYKEQKSLDYPQDGFIITPNGKYNYHSDKLPLYKRNLRDYPDVCKWKPPPQITIDFRVKDGQLWVYNMKSKREEPFTGSYIYPLGAVSEEFNAAIYQNKIVESAYDLVCKILKPLKIRYDKDGPNRLDIAEANWDDLHDYISEEDLSGDTLSLVKKYHNQIKNILYDIPTIYPSLNIGIKSGYNLLDVGSGVGGDLGKWAKSKVNKVITVEPNNKNLTNLYERLKTSNVNVTTINTVGEDYQQITKVVKKEVGQVDVISLMLSLSFFWASESHLDALVQTIAMNLKLGGFVVFLTIDGDDLGADFKDYTTQQYNDATFTFYGNGQNQPNDNKAYGQFVRAEITGIVGKQWEFLVHLDDLTSKLEKYGIVLRAKRSAVDEQLLSVPAKLYTSLFTYGYYEKVKEVKFKIKNIILPEIIYPIIEPLEPLNYDEIISFNGPLKNMTAIGCSDLLDAILKAFNEAYQNDEDRLTLKETFREELADAMDEHYDFNHGYFQKKLLNQIADMLQNKNNDIDYTLLGLQYFLRSDEPIDPLLNYVAYIIDIDIFIFDHDFNLLSSTFTCDKPKPHFMMIVNDGGYELIGQYKDNEGTVTLFPHDELYKLELPYYSIDDTMETNIKTLFGPTLPNLSTIINETDPVYKMIETAYTNVYVTALIKNIAKVYKTPAPNTAGYDKLVRDVSKLFVQGDLKPILDQFKKIPIKTGRVEERIDTITDMIKNLNFETGGMKVLDIGAGTGQIIQAVKKYYNLPKSDVYAIDQKLPNIKDITTLTYDKNGNIPLPNQSIDVILMFNVLHHIPIQPRLEILKEVQRILVPGGLVIIREHADDHDPNFEKFIDLIHQFWYISENEHEDPLVLMTREETTQLMSDIGLKSVYYTTYNQPNPQHTYHEAFQSTYDDFPYKKYSMDMKDVDKRFNNLKRYKFETVKMAYTIRNIPGNWYNNPKLKYNNLLIVNKPSDYLTYNLISDYWIDECKVRAKRYDQPLNPFDYWQQNKDYVKQQAQKLYGAVNDYTLRETIFKLAGEVTTFRETVAVGFIKMFKSKRILDPSAGWFNRAIAAMACGVEAYVGVDPNSCLHPKYQEMINYFPSTTKVTMIQAPFEEAILPDITFDLIMTSFPYFNLEVYTDEPTQSIANRDLNTWFDDFLIFSMNKAWDRLEKGGKMIIIVNDIKDQANYVKLMVDVFTDIHDDAEYLGVISYSEFVDNKPKQPNPCWIWNKK